MATYNYNMDSSYSVNEFGVGQYIFTISPTTNASNRQQLEVGDYVAIKYNTASGHSNSITLAYDTSQFSGTASQSVTVGNTITRQVKVGATVAEGDIVCTLANSTRRIYYTVGTPAPPVDTTPDAFTFADVTDATLSTTYVTAQVTITGINDSVTASVSGSALFRLNGTGSYTSADKTVIDGDKIDMQMVSSGSYSTAVSSTLTVGGTSDTWSITTKSTPPPGLQIPFPITSGRIGISDIRNFFGDSHKLGDYTRGGIYVPELSPENDSIKTTKSNMKFSDYYGSATIMRFETEPGDKFAAHNTAEGTGVTLSIQTTKNTDFTLGHGQGMRYRLEIRYSVIFADTGVTITVGNGSLDTWSSTSTHVRTEVSKTNALEEDFIVDFKVEIRHPDSPTQIDSRTFRHRYWFLGQ